MRFGGRMVGSVAGDQASAPAPACGPLAALGWACRIGNSVANGRHPPPPRVPFGGGGRGRERATAGFSHFCFFDFSVSFSPIEVV